MFRNIYFNEDITIKIDLYKNRREKVCEIPLDYVENIVYKFNDIDEISLSIPRYITRLGEMKTNHIYSKIATRQQLVVTTINLDGTSSQQRFVLHNKKSFATKNSGSKSFTAYSWEKTLEKQRISVEQLSRQLTNKDDNVNIGEGILDLICKKTGWNVGNVDQDARYKTSSAVQTFNLELFNNYKSNTVIAENGLIFEKNVMIPASTNKPLYINVSYTNLRTIYDNTVISNMNIINNLSSTPISYNITKIRAEHYSGTGNRYGIKYILTLDIPLNNTNDKNTVEIITTFTNCANKLLECDKISIGYDYGDVVEVRNIQYVNFEAFDDSAFKFLQDVEEAFDCVFDYDTMNNSINVYAKSNLNQNNGYKLGLGSNISEVNISEGSDIITCLKVESDNTSIIEENPNGTNIIEDYSYYIKHNIISENLKNTLEIYNKLAEERQKEWLAAKTSKSVAQQRYTKAQSEAKTLEERIKNLTFRLTQFITDKQADKQAEAKAEIEALELQYTKVINQMATIKTEINTLEDKMSVISTSINKSTATDNNGKKLFSDEDLQELNDMHEILTYTDSYYTTSYGLYSYALRYMAEKIKPDITFSLKSDELNTYITNPNGWNKILKLGNLFTIEKEDVFEEYDISEVRLVQYKIIPSEEGRSLKVSDFSFSNKIKLENTLKVGSNISRTTNKNTGVVNSYRDLWENSKVVNNFVGDMITSGLNIAAANIKGGVYRNILDFSEAGCFIINNTDAGNTDNQIYLGGGTIAITNDAWKTSNVAVDYNGVIADAIFGKLLLGEKLVITSDDGLFYVGNGESEAQQKRKEFGLYIYNNIGGVDRIFLGLSQDDDGVRRAKLRLKDATGNQVVLSEEGIVQTSQFVCWDNVSKGYPMRVPYFCDEGVKENRKIILSMVFEKYRAFERGMSAGGSVNTSSSGGGGTSAAGGGGTSASGGGGTSASGGGGTTASGGQTSTSGTATTSSGGGSYYKSEQKTSQVQQWQNQNLNVVGIGTGEPKGSDFNKHTHIILSGLLNHSHSTDIVVDIPNHTHSTQAHSHQIGSHTHNISAHTHTISPHTHTIPDHTHNISDHTHTIDTTHNHNLEYGIFEQDSRCSNVKVYVNNVLVNTNAPINSDVQLDITKHIRIGQKNDIRIETETNGRISCNLFTKSFVAF